MPKRTGMSEAVIAARALALVDEVGLDGLSMRRLATALEVSAMTLYSYFSDREALLDAVLAEGAHSVWAHGMLPAADALARSAGLTMTRSLHRMSRPLGPDDEADPDLPAGFSVRPFEPGRDDEEWRAEKAAERAAEKVAELGATTGRPPRSAVAS